MKKRFNIEYYLAHPETKIVTRNGKSVRILCTDFGHDIMPILAAIDYGRHKEVVYQFFPDGTLRPLDESQNDIFFEIPEPAKRKVPLTYEDLFDRVKAGKTMWITNRFSGGRFQYSKHIIGFGTKFVVIADCMNANPRVSRFAIEELMIYTFVDGDPCWK